MDIVFAYHFTFMSTPDIVLKTSIFSITFHNLHLKLSLFVEKEVERDGRDKRVEFLVLQATNGKVVSLRMVIAIDRSVRVMQVPSPRRRRIKSRRRPVDRVVATIGARASAGAVTTKGESEFIFERV